MPTEFTGSRQARKSNGNGRIFQPLRKFAGTPAVPLTKYDHAFPVDMLVLTGAPHTAYSGDKVSTHGVPKPLQSTKSSAWHPDEAKKSRSAWQLSGQKVMLDARHLYPEALFSAV